MVSNEQVKTITSGISTETHSSQDPKSYLRLQERTLEDRAMSTPPPPVLFIFVDALTEGKLHSNQEVNCDYNIGHLAMSQISK
jgi:hypothetical protein